MRLLRARKVLRQSMSILIELKLHENPILRTTGPAVWQGLAN